MYRILLLLLLVSNTASATNYYRLEKTTAPYAQLTGDTLVPLITRTDNSGYEYVFELAGTTFSFFNKNYQIDDTGIFVYFSTNGHLGIQTDTSFIIFDALFTYLDSIDAASAVSYKIEGTGNSRIVKLQWKNLRLRAGQAGNYANAQIWLYQATGIVELRYGPSSASNQSGYSSINGPNVGMFHSHKTFTQMYEKIWLNGSPASYTVDSAKNNVFNAMSGVPAEGTMYRFVPAHLLSVKETATAKHQYRIYPNPASDELTISSLVSSKEPALVQLFDMSGRKVLETIIEPGEEKIVLSTRNVPDGIYELHINSPSGIKRSTISVLHK